MMDKIIRKLKLIFVPCEENKFRPHFLKSKFLLYYILVLFVLKVSVLPLLYCLPESSLFADLTKTSLMEMMNTDRTSLGMQSLKENEKLNEAARLKAQDMMEKDYFAHYSPEGTTPWFFFDQADYSYKFAGENLAIGFIDSEEVYGAWLDSPTHKENILNAKYSETGIAILKGDFQGKETILVVQLFGFPSTTISKVETEKPIAQEKEVISFETSTGPAVAGETAEPEKENRAAEKIFYFLSFDYYDIFQKVIYGSLIFIIAALLVNIFVRIDVQFKDLIFKTLGFLLILFTFIIIDKAEIVRLISDGIRIN